jgi:hypothetical protein
MKKKIFFIIFLLFLSSCQITESPPLIVVNDSCTRYTPIDFPLTSIKKFNVLSEEDINVRIFLEQVYVYNSTWQKYCSK